MSHAYQVEISKGQVFPTSVTITRPGLKQHDYKKPTQTSLNRLDKILNTGFSIETSDWKVEVVFSYKYGLYVRCLRVSSN
jgi:hypothetical protein